MNDILKLFEVENSLLEIHKYSERGITVPDAGPKNSYDTSILYIRYFCAGFLGACNSLLITMTQFPRLRLQNQT